MKPFFLCWREGDRNPMVKHDTLDDAKNEAVRIAMKELCAVHIMKLVSTCTATVKIEWEHPNFVRLPICAICDQPKCVCQESTE